MPNKEIARRLQITERTVKSHLTSVFRHIGVTDRTQAALWAERNGVRVSVRLTAAPAPAPMPPQRRSRPSVKSPIVVHGGSDRVEDRVRRVVLSQGRRWRRPPSPAPRSECRKRGEEEHPDRGLLVERGGRVASIPSIPGRRRSMSTTSGADWRQRATAVSPSRCEPDEVDIADLIEQLRKPLGGSADGHRRARPAWVW